MAVPKSKTSKSKRNMRRAHDAQPLINVVVDPVTGEYKLPHHMNNDGTYKGRKVLVAKKSADEKAAEVEAKADATL